MTNPEGYGLEPRFEQAVLHACACKQAFWKRLGGELDPKRMGHKYAPIILAASRIITKEVGRSPSQCLVVLQRVRRWYEEGKIPFEVVEGISDLFDDVEDRPPIPVQELVQELVPIVRRKMQSEAVLAAADDYARQGDLSAVADLVRKAQHLGESEAVDTTSLTHLNDLDAHDGLERLATPIPELTVALDGGPARGSESIVMAESGGGKSMFLVDQAAHAAQEGHHVAVASLELPKHIQKARLVANLTDLPVNRLLRDSDTRGLAAARLERLQSSLGPVQIGEFTPYVTTTRDLIEWIDTVEQSEGRKVDVLVVDYGDKLTDPKAKADNEYLVMRYVFEGMRRDIAVERDLWLWTATQPGRRGRKDAKHNLDLSDASDSMHKVRVSDLLVTMNYEEPDDYSQTTIFVAKNRTGPGRFSVGPIPTDFSKARVCAHAATPF